MTTIVAEPTAPAPTQRPRPAYKVTGGRVLRSEWAKFWSLRSTWITLGASLLFLVGFGVIAAAHYKSVVGSGGRLDPDEVDATAASLSLFGVNVAQLSLGVLGVLVTAGEYSTGMIRSTLAAVPKRLPVLWSKAAVYGLVSLLLATAGAFGAFLIGNRILGGTAAHLSLSTPGVVRSLLGAAGYLCLIGIMGVALGSWLRSVAGGISVQVAALTLVPGLFSLLPKSWDHALSPYLPSNAGASMFELHQKGGTLTVAGGFGILVAWTALALAGAAYRLMRSDA
jgi:ABC-2 type transport system permease protein